MNTCGTIENETYGSLRTNKPATLQQYVEWHGIEKVIDYGFRVRECDDIFKLRGRFVWDYNDYSLDFKSELLPVFEKALEVYGRDYNKATREDIIDIYNKYFK